MRVNGDQARKLLRGMGIRTAESWTDEKTLKYLNDLDKKAEQFEEPKEQDDINLLHEIISCLKSDEKVNIEGYHPEKDIRPRVKKEKKRDTSVPERRAEHQTGYKEITKPTVTKMTVQLAEKFRDMEPFPNDRPLSANRLAEFKQIMVDGDFRGAEWASVTVGDKTYRVNGKHTSTAACDVFESGQELLAHITVRQFEAENMEGAARLYSTFDPRVSSRTKTDVLRAFSSASDLLSGKKSRYLSVITAGLAYAKWGDKYKKHNTNEQAELLVANTEFANWVASYWDGAENQPKHVIRMSVVAAMYLTTEKETYENAMEFWQKIRDDSDGKKSDPARKLYTFLISHKVGAVKAIPADRTDDREILWLCLSAWNAWKTGKPLPEYSIKHPMPTVL